MTEGTALLAEQVIRQELLNGETVRVELSFHVQPSDLPEIEPIIESMLEYTGAEIERWTHDGQQREP